MKRVKKTYVLIFLAALCLFSAGILFFKGETPVAAAAEKTKVKVMSVGESQNAAFSYAGEIHSQYESELAFMTSGKVIKRCVKTGDKVHAGQVLAILDNRDLKQSVHAAQAQNETARSALELAQKNLSRYQTLCQQGAVSQMEFDKMKQEYDAAAARVRETAAQVNSSNNQLGYSTLTADRDGVITKIDINAGEVVEAGETVATLADENSLEAVFEVPEDKIASLQEGTVVTVKANGQAYQGSVCEIASMADEATRTFKVKASLPAGTALHLGMTAQISLPSVSIAGIFIPRSAVVDQNGSGVWLENKGRITFASITTGNVQGDNVEVLSGLKDGDQVVTAGVQKVYDGEEVEVMK